MSRKYETAARSIMVGRDTMGARWEESYVDVVIGKDYNYS